MSITSTNTDILMHMLLDIVLSSRRNRPNDVKVATMSAIVSVEMENAIGKLSTQEIKPEEYSDYYDRLQTRLRFYLDNGGSLRY